MTYITDTAIQSGEKLVAMNTQSLLNHLAISPYTRVTQMQRGMIVR